MMLTGEQIAELAREEFRKRQQKRDNEWKEKCRKYPLEPIRDFFVRRQWLVGENKLITDEEYKALKMRTLKLRGQRLVYLTGFCDGWRAK